MKKLILAVVLIVSALSFGTAFAFSPSKHQAVASTITYVDIKDSVVTPNQLTIPIGQTVQFNTKDGLSHQMGLGEGSGNGHQHEDGQQAHEHDGSYTSGEFGAGEAWKVTFKQAGTFTFHDHLHPNINILIVAYQPKQ
jgi:plastocyanin